MTPPRRLSRPAPGGGGDAHRRHRHRQHLAGRARPLERLADLQQPERDADSRQLFRRLRPHRQRPGRHPVAANRGRGSAASGPGDRVRGRLSDRPAEVPRRRTAGPNYAGRLQPADPAGHGQFQHSLRDLSAHGAQHGPAAGGRDPVGDAAKRGRQPGGRRHSRRAVRRLRRQSQPRGSPAAEWSRWRWTSRRIRCSRAA